MRVLSYNELDTSNVRSQFEKVRTAIERDDFRSADVKKLSQGRYYRAKLDYENRLLLQFVRYGEELVCLALEVIENHAYEKSRFLRGALVDEAKIEEANPTHIVNEAQTIRYLHPGRKDFHLLDKVISFDEVQDSIYKTIPPLILVGSAGSGKTALMLEKMRHIEGQVLYVTHSAYLAQNARNLYFSHGYENPRQESEFLSYREFLETLRVPSGREVTFTVFRSWFERHKQQYSFSTDAHQLFEEIRGVLTSQPSGVLSRKDYMALGVRQSIFSTADRESVYSLFEKYRLWLKETTQFDSNLVAHEWLALAKPHFDFVVIDEVQDLTMVQLALVLKTLKNPEHFLLCGDSNQIVHPNFFSWAAVKSLFWKTPELAERQTISVLKANFRNSREVTRIANTLLKIKHARFGSIDRESNFLVESATLDKGRIECLPDKDAAKRELNQKTCASVQFAVLVLRDEDKAEARKFFQTPLVFSIHEAKGLEYSNIILYNMVSGQRQIFSTICEGVTKTALKTDSLDYRRAKDKTDKSLEIYKFYINALYVALTRAIERVYLIESDLKHPLLQLLEIQTENEAVNVQVQKSSRDDWEKEAHRLELQGKQEQANAIRKDILKTKTVPWLVWNESLLNDMLSKALDNKNVSSKPYQMVYDYALWHEQQNYMQRLALEAGYKPACHILGSNNQPIRRTSQAQEAARLITALSAKHLAPFSARNFKDVLSQCDQYGIDYRTVVNTTPLMLATLAGHVSLVEALIARGADVQAMDHYGHTALSYALCRAQRDDDYVKGSFGALYQLIAPEVLDVEVEGRLIRLYPHQAEYFILNLMMAYLKNLRSDMLPDADPYYKRQRGMFTDYLMRNIECFPYHIVRDERKKRTYFNHVLARGEANSRYSPARKLWVRRSNGYYIPNPKIKLRVKNPQGELVWCPIYDVLNLSLINQGTGIQPWHMYSSELANAWAIETISQ